MKTYYPEYKDRAKEIAMRVTYSFELIYDMVMMGLSADEIELLCRYGASLELPEYKWDTIYDMHYTPFDMHDIARGLRQIKTEGILERFNEIFDSVIQKNYKQKPILSNRDRNNYHLQ